MSEICTDCHQPIPEGEVVVVGLTGRLHYRCFQLGKSQGRELPKRTAAELARDLRIRAEYLCGQAWELPATIAMMREAADLLEESDGKTRT